MKIKFKELPPLRGNTRESLETVNSIIGEYLAEGYKLTLRQLYYQLVARGLIDNHQKEYNKLGRILTLGRMCGIVDWDAIEDRLREPFLPYFVSGIPGAINDTIAQYRLDRMKDQDVYLELWVEKDALSSVLRRVTSHYHINLMVNRGYTSTTAVYAAFERLTTAVGYGKLSYVLYLGDHDPSGLDMISDIESRLETFGVSPEIRHIALTMKQIKKYNPPPSPTKITDSRAKKYISEHGSESWEVDALKPQVLNRLVIDSIESLIDLDKFKRVYDQESIDKEELKRLKL